MLNARELKVFYGVIQGLKGVDIDVYDREIVTLIGSNGAGKTSTLNGIVNLVRSSGARQLPQRRYLTQPDPPDRASRAGAGARGTARLYQPDHRREPAHGRLQ